MQNKGLKKKNTWCGSRDPLAYREVPVTDKNGNEVHKRHTDKLYVAQTKRFNDAYKTKLTPTPTTHREKTIRQPRAGIHVPGGLASVDEAPQVSGEPSGRTERTRRFRQQPRAENHEVIGLDRADEALLARYQQALLDEAPQASYKTNRSLKKLVREGHFC